MKKLIGLSLFCLASTTFATEKLANYDQIKSAALAGQTIHIVTDFSKCTINNKPASGMMNYGIITPTEIAVLPNSIATSMMHFTLYNPSNIGKPVYEFVRYDINEDNNVVLTMHTMDAATYTSIGKSYAVSCPLNSGAIIYT